MSPFQQRHANRRSQMLAERAARMRAEPTASEATLLRALRRRQLGVQFRQQVVIADQHIVDFLAPELLLIVEVDGAYHQRRAAADASREAKLRRLGYRVLRFEAKQVLADLPGVVAAIVVAVAEGPVGG